MNINNESHSLIMKSLIPHTLIFELQGAGMVFNTYRNAESGDVGYRLPTYEYVFDWLNKKGITIIISASRVQDEIKDQRFKYCELCPDYTCGICYKGKLITKLYNFTYSEEDYTEIIRMAARIVKFNNLKHEQR